MSLDLVVGACAKPGHEDEWRQILDRDFAGQLTEAEISRFGKDKRRTCLDCW